MELLTRLSLFGLLYILVFAIAPSLIPEKPFCCSSRGAVSQDISRTSFQQSLICLIYQLFSRTEPLQDEKSDWHLFYHLGGNGPWIEKNNGRFGAYEKDGKPPEGCVIDQVHMLSRHAERYPTKNAGARHLSLLSRLHNLNLNGSLSFLNNQNWTYFAPVPLAPAKSNSNLHTFENLTTTSPYAGTLSSFTLGTIFRTRYSHLLGSSSPTDVTREPLHFFTASSERDIWTSLYFADALLGRSWDANDSSHQPLGSLHIIPETCDRGGNTLTPSETCLQYMTNKTHGHDLGYAKLAEWQSVFTQPISARLSAPNPELEPSFTALEVYSMMELCGFEILVRGSSPWCDVFSRSEWEDFAYGRDLLHFYRAGPGNMFSRAMGNLWLDATTKLLGQDSQSRVTTVMADAEDGVGREKTKVEIYTSFVHDGDIVPVLAALGAFNEGTHSSDPQELPTHRNKRDRNWRTSDLVPMAGRLIIERLDCATPHGWRYRDVRLFVNDGWVGWPVPGAGGKTVFVPQLEVGRLRDMIQENKEKFGSFVEVCGLDEGAPSEIDFLHQ